MQFKSGDQRNLTVVIKYCTLKKNINLPSKIRYSFANITKLVCTKIRPHALYYYSIILWLLGSFFWGGSNLNPLCRLVSQLSSQRFAHWNIVFCQLCLCHFFVGPWLCWDYHRVTRKPFKFHHYKTFAAKYENVEMAVKVVYLSDVSLRPTYVLVRIRVHGQTK